jgi:excinuclease UvrABC nuclease subunit
MYKGLKTFEYLESALERELPFLTSSDTKTVERLSNEIETAVSKLEFEKAALLRDQIAFLRGEGNEKKLQSKSVGCYNKKKYGRRRKYNSKKY